MNEDRGDDLSAELEQARKELTAWRATPGKGQKIPEPVWRKAARAAKRHGLNSVSKALGLDYSCLKRRVLESPGASHGRSAWKPAFVELKATVTTRNLACVVELEKSNGTRLRICAGAAHEVDWGKIKEVFLGA